MAHPTLEPSPALAGAANGHAGATRHQIIIEPSKGWQLVKWAELIEYRDLIYFLTLRGITAKYKQSVLGVAWAFLQPIVQTLVFTFIFGSVAKISSDGAPYALFSFVALMPWNYFSGAMTQSTGSLISGKAMFTKVYFPRLVLPLVPVVSRLLDFFISVFVLGILLVYFGVAPTLNMLMLPLLLVILMMTAAGIGMWLSALALQYRDVNYALSFSSRLLMYLAPVVWPLSLITEKFGETVTLLYSIYPLVGVIEGFRAAILGTRPMPWDLIAIGGVSALVLFITGAFYFKRMESRMADVA